MSISSPLYILTLIVAPFLMAHQGKVRVLSHLLLSLGVFAFACGSLQLWLISMAIIMVPFVYKRWFKQKLPILLLILIGFLYLNQYEWILSPLGIPPSLIHIIGLSYIVFRQVDIIFTEESVTLIEYLSYVLSFYTLLAGPIDRFKRFKKNLNEPSDVLNKQALYKTMNRIVNGYFKVTVISTILHSTADMFFKMGGLSFVPFSILNTAFIYFNFSGYCDVVIGFGSIARIELPENFNKPYLARDIRDFWNRQHITLTQWITDYIFTPTILALNRFKWISFSTSQYLSFFITFLIAGLWHGSTKEYLIYGLLQAVGVCITKVYQDTLKMMLKKKRAVIAFRERSIVRVIEWFITQSYIAMSFIFIGYQILERS